MNKDCPACASPNTNEITVVDVEEPRTMCCEDCSYQWNIDEDEE